MSFKDFIETFQSIALRDKVNPTDEANWNYICREYSKIFHTPLHEVFKLSPEFVCQHIFAEQFSEFDIEENMESLQDTLSSLLDPEFDIKRERAYREELKKIQEDEDKRLEEGRPVHHSLVKKKPGLPIEEPTSNLPKSGGLSSGLINQLKNDGKNDF